MINSGYDAVGIKDLKRHLMNTFKMKDFGYLGILPWLEISLTKVGIRIHQGKYAEDLLSMT